MAWEGRKYILQKSHIASLYLAQVTLWRPYRITLFGLSCRDLRFFTVGDIFVGREIDLSTLTDMTVEISSLLFESRLNFSWK